MQIIHIADFLFPLSLSFSSFGSLGTANTSVCRGQVIHTYDSKFRNGPAKDFRKIVKQVNYVHIRANEYPLMDRDIMAANLVKYNSNF